MKRTILFSLAALALTGCKSTADLNATLETLNRIYSHCDRTVTYAATVGAINPASGAQIQGTVHCPPVVPADPGPPPIEGPPL